MYRRNHHERGDPCDPVEEVEVMTENIFKKYREAAGMTQAEAAKKLGLARQSMLSQIENGRKFPGFPLLCQLADLYGCKLDDFRQVG